MSVKTAGTGHFLIPTAPAAGTSCTSGAANVFTTTYVQLIASTAAALYITGIYVEAAAVSAATYKVLQLATGAAASEVIIGQYPFAPQTGSTTTLTYRPIFPPIPVPISTRIACKTADSVGAQANLITLECIAQSNVVDDGITVGTVNLVNTTTTVTNQLTAAAIATGVWTDTTAGDFTTSLSIGKSVMNGVSLGTGLTINGYTGNTVQTGDAYARIGTAGVGLTNLGDTRIANLDATVSSRMATYTQPSGFLAATFPTGTVANTTNITAGTITTTTNLTNAPTAGDFTAVMKTSLNAATPASVVGAVGSVTGSVGSVVGLTASNLDATVSSRSTYAGGAVASVTGSVGSVVGLTAANLDAAVSTRLATASYTSPPSAATIATSVLTTQMTESYPALHTAPTLAQSLFETRALLAEKSVTGTTMTVNKVDGSTAAETYTLNDATAPTAITRAT